MANSAENNEAFGVVSSPLHQEQQLGSPNPSEPIGSSPQEGGAEGSTFSGETLPPADVLSAHDPHAGDELLGAVTAISADHIDLIDHALDQLANSTNLFDVSVIGSHCSFGDHHS